MPSLGFLRSGISFLALNASLIRNSVRRPSFPAVQGHRAACERSRATTEGRTYENAVGLPELCITR